MAFATVAIGILPTYSIGKYQAGVAAPILLALLRILQGLAMGGEFGAAVIYISELAHKARRGMFVAVLQMSVNVGMITATLLVMLLQNTLSKGARRRWVRRGGGGSPSPTFAWTATCLPALGVSTAQPGRPCAAAEPAGGPASPS